jgi:hypothetical protein
MTKRVRIENADTSKYKVLVEIWDKGVDGQPDTLVATKRLDYPTAMTDEHVYITSTRYLVVKEAPAE